MLAQLSRSGTPFSRKNHANRPLLSRCNCLRSGNRWMKRKRLWFLGLCGRHTDCCTAEKAQDESDQRGATAFQHAESTRIRWCFCRQLMAHSEHRWDLCRNVLWPLLATIEGCIGRNRSEKPEKIS